MLRPIRHRPALLAGLALLFSAPAAADPPAFDVTVINDASSTIPVTIEGGDPVPVSIEAGAPEQPILIQLSATDATPGPDVFLVVENVQRACVGSPGVCESPNTPYVVPAGKTLVIETVSVIGEAITTTPALMTASLNIQPPGAGGAFGFDLGLTDLIDPSRRTWAKTFAVALRAPAGSQLGGGVVWEVAPQAPIAASTVISGRLVDAP